MTRPRALALLLLMAHSTAFALAHAADDTAEAEFFESRVRPILVNRCQSCHGGGKAKGGLRLESRAEAMTGGLTGPAVVAGKPAESLLVDAINYGDVVQMPPKSKLPAEEIAILTRWVELGAPWPVGPESGPSGLARSFDLRERSKHWSWQPAREPAPPAVRDDAWPITPVDRFLLAKLEAKGLKPAPEADRRTLIRRVTFDLIGLPPTPAEVDAFVDDRSADAYEKVVDRLLASPAHGERWARHWLDLVRFAETSGHEFDYEIPEAYRYRDYVIRAINADLPYDRFVIEQVAGDLVPDPRRDPVDGTNQSALGTGFFRLHEGNHSPVDVREDAATKIDNQIDVLGKTFLGLTIACARCHDHKFDAITTRDYYALAGYLASSRHQLAFLDPPAKIAEKVAELDEIRDEVARIIPGPTGPPAPPSVKADRPADILFEDFSGPTFAGWFPAGDAFGTGPTRPGSWRIRRDMAEALPAGVAHSGATSDRLRGVLRSRTFTIERKLIQVLATGHHGRINLVIDGFEKIRAPIYGGLVVDVDSGDTGRWYTIDAGTWLGHTAYLELDDGATVDFTGGIGSIRPGDGFLAVDEVWFSDRPARAIPPRPEVESFGPSKLPGLAPLLARFRAIESSIPEPTLGQAMADGTGLDERVHIRGSAKTLGEAVPRRFLEVLSDPSATTGPTDGSGRLELARRLVEPTNPLTARVLVNRLWHHHFGRGIVPSVDDFGVMGRGPSHPELLDYLASRFVASGWSLKAMHRLIVTSRAYRMSSRPDPEADRLDPGNELWHRRGVRRLEAEAIRDAILAASGRLDRTLFGPSVPPHLTEFMDGRGRPKQSGPLDGGGRRSLYINVRRNFLTPMLLAFDFPTPSAPMGRRNVSNVPAQALTLMNDPFVLGQARVWADRVRADPKVSPSETVDRMYGEAFSRPPSDDERSAALAFLDGQSEEPRAWADLAHVLFNVKEFTSVP